MVEWEPTMNRLLSGKRNKMGGAVARPGEHPLPAGRPKEKNVKLKSHESIKGFMTFFVRVSLMVNN